MSPGAPNPWEPRLLLRELGLAHVRKESGMGRAALGEVGTGLSQAEGSIHRQPDFGGVAILLAIILPPADGTQGQRFGRVQRLVSATWATKTGHQRFPHEDWTATTACVFTREASSAVCGESQVLKGYGFTACGKTHSSSQEASGHDFSRAANASMRARALAPEGILDCNKDLFRGSLAIRPACASPMIFVVRVTLFSLPRGCTLPYPLKKTKPCQLMKTFVH